MARFGRLVTSPITPGAHTLAVAVDDWHAIVFQNAWTANAAGETPAYFKDPWGVVHLVGSITAGTIVANTVVTNFPIGYRPAARNLFNLLTYNLFTLTQFAVSNTVDGDLTILGGAIGAGGSVALDGVSWRAKP